MSGYIGNIPVPQATQTRQTFTATASQTTFNTAGYTAGFVDVYMNGVKLVDGTDFTATNGSDVVLTSGAAAGDVIEVVAYSTYQVNSQNYTGGVTVDNDGATVLTVDRATSDGTIVDLQKDGTSVGGIASRAGVVTSVILNPSTMGITEADTGGGPSLSPTNGSGAISDAAIDLGTSSIRWQDLYLSGGVYLGGTGSANKLDDYEEGTFVPYVSLTYNPSNRTITDNGAGEGRYTKIGNLVLCEMKVGWTGISGSGGRNVGIQNLPFTKATGGIVSNGSGRSNTSGSMYQMESVTGNQVTVIRKYDNGTPADVDSINCFIIYRTT